MTANRMAVGAEVVPDRAHGWTRRAAAFLLLLMMFVVMTAACTGGGDADVALDDVDPGSESAERDDAAEERDPVPPAIEPDVATPIAPASDTRPPAAAVATATTARSGAWSDGATWSAGSPPAPWSAITVRSGHNITLDQSADVFRLDLEGGLTFSTRDDAVLRSRRNVVVTGRLEMGWSDTVRHELRFVDVDESEFVGGGVDVLESDVGLWVMGRGVLSVEGREKRGWTNAVGSIPVGATTIEVEDAKGWTVGDVVVISPTKAGSSLSELGHSYNGFHESTIASVSGNRITLSTPTRDPHPVVNGKWTAEVMNLTRNVVIGGEDYQHKPHIFIRSTQPTHMRYVEVPYVAPGRIFDGGWDADGQVLGRYGIHFHHGFDGAQGSLLEGVSMHDFGFRGFVTHMSNGITLRDTVAYNGAAEAYWWDQQEPSHDILWDRTIGAKISAVDGVYFLGSGDNLEVRDSVAVGSIVKTNSGGYEWENGDTGSWEFTGNIAHNLRGNGIRIWQNTQENHILSDFAIYQVDEVGIRVGAYTNNYHFKNFEIYDYGWAGLELLAVPRAPHSDVVRPVGVVAEGGIIDGADRSTGSSIVFRDSAIPGAWPARVRDVVIRGRAAQEEPAISVHQFANSKKIDIVDVTIEDGPTPHYFLDVETDTGDGDGITWMRVQNGTEAFRLRPSDQTPDPGARSVPEWNATRVDIDPFVPQRWGSGTGLWAEYFSDFDYTDKHFETVDPYIELFQEDLPIYHTLTGDRVGARWTGQVEAQVSGRHSFQALGDRVRLTIDGRVLVDTMNGQANTPGAIDLVAGRRYDLLFEVHHDAARRDGLRFEADLIWDYPGDRGPEYIPQSQLHLPAGIADRPHTSNDPVIVNVGGGSGVTPLDTILADTTLHDRHSQVLRLYWAVFDRPPDPGGASYWIDQIDTCASLWWIASFFTRSPEFVNTYGAATTNEGFLRILYDNVFDRAPDAGGLRFWLSEMGSGRIDRAAAVLLFSDSPEFRALRPLPSDGRPVTPCQRASRTV